MDFWEESRKGDFFFDVCVAPTCILAADLSNLSPPCRGVIYRDENVVNPQTCGCSLGYSKVETTICSFEAACRFKELALAPGFVFELQRLQLPRTLEGLEGTFHTSQNQALNLAICIQLFRPELSVHSPVVV